MKIINLTDIGSTNDFLLDTADNYSDEMMTVAVTDYQSSGHGMGSNTWESEAGCNLLFSILVHPGWLPIYAQFLLSMTEAVAIREVLAKLLHDNGCDADDLTVKWPNDIYWRNRKLSGTRIDANLKGFDIKDMVIGTGINVNQTVFVSDAPNPVSLKQITGREIDRRKLLDDILGRFVHYYHIAEEEWGSMEECDTIMHLYHKHLFRSKGIHRYEDDEGEFEARLMEVHPNGIMLLLDTDNNIRQYEFKEVKFLL